MIFSRILIDARNQNWATVIADLLIVVIGLFTGLQVDAWWQNYQDSTQEKVYLQELKQDFDGNKILLSGVLEQGQMVLDDMVTLARQALLETPSLPSEELDARLSSLQSMQSFLPITSAYDNLVASSELGIIRNRDLKNKLADYYSLAKLAEVVQTTHELQLVEIFQPYMRANTEMARVMVSWQEDDEFQLPEPRPDSGTLDIISTREFRNVVTEKYYSAIDLYSIHQDLEEITEEVLTLLEAELNDQ